MNVLSVLCLLFLILDCIIIVYILTIGARKKIHVIFLVMIVSYVFWNFTGIVMYSAENREVFDSLLVPCAIFLLCLPFTVHFVLEFCGVAKPFKVPLLIVNYALAVPFLILHIRGELLYNDFIRIDGYWHFLPAPMGPIQFLFLLYCISSLVFPGILLLRWRRRARYAREKSQATILIGAVCVVCALFLFEHFVLGSFGLNLAATAVYFNLWTVSIWISIIKYRFMTITPDKISKLVIEHIDEALFVLETDGTLLFTNAAAKRLLKIPREIAGFPISRFLRAPDAFEKIRSRMGNDLRGPDTVRLDFTAGDGGALPLDLEIKPIEDKSKNTLGILLLGREVHELERFKSLFHVSDREVEVIRYTLSGASSKAIASSLGITERTVKAHLEHIYDKLNVKNRVQLFSFMKEYDLFPAIGITRRALNRRSAG